MCPLHGGTTQKWGAPKKISGAGPPLLKSLRRLCERIPYSMRDSQQIYVYQALMLRLTLVETNLILVENNFTVSVDIRSHL